MTSKREAGCPGGRSKTCHQMLHLIARVLCPDLPLHLQVDGLDKALPLPGLFPGSYIAGGDPILQDPWDPIRLSCKG